MFAKSESSQKFINTEFEEIKTWEKRLITEKARIKIKWKI